MIRFLTVRDRITLGLVSILMSSIFLAIVLGFGPDSRQATMQGRKTLCESIAINSSIMISQNDINSIEQSLAALVERDADLMSAGLRRADNQLVVDIGDHYEKWGTDVGRSTETQIQVPLWAGKDKWGTVELSFRSVTVRGISGLMHNPWTKHMAVVGLICFVVFSFYLRMVLRQLDPSKAIPKRVRSALDALAEGLLITDKKGRVVLANDAFAKWAGKPADKLIGHDAAKFPWSRKEHENEKDCRFPWNQAIEEQSPQSNCILELNDSNNKTLILVANSSPVLQQADGYRGVLTSFEDVTELEQHKVELSDAKHAADAANQAKSDFLARMSHEIRTPMNAILGYTEILQRGYAENEEKRQEHLLTIQNSGEHLLALINDILDLSKIEAGRMKFELARCSPHEVISQVVSVLSIKSKEKGLTLRFEAEGELPETILTDAVRLRQAVINLVGNAIKFTEEGGVRIRARFIQAAQPLFAIDVIDTGIGISQQALATIFDPFSQADTTITRRFGGTGLGLSICRQLAEQMGGEVSVVSELGVGTTFTFTLDPGPLDSVPFIQVDDLVDDAVVDLGVPQKKQQQQVLLPPSRVLVVDDGEANRQLISLFLRRAGAEVLEAENGQVAVQLACESKVDIILMDMQMPVMDGFTATRKLRELGQTMPIFALTANVMDDDEEKCQEAGCNGFLAKPINMDRLLNAVCEALGGEMASDPGLLESDSSNRETTEMDPHSVDETCQSVRDELVELANDLNAESVMESSLPTDDPEFREIVECFVVRLREQVAEMRRVATDGHHSELADLAHWLKGAGGSVGFDAFTAPAAALQTSAESQDLEAIETNLSIIESLNSRIRVSSADSVRVSS